MKPHSLLPRFAPPFIPKDSILSSGTSPRGGLPLSETAGTIIHHVVYTDRNLAVFTDKGIFPFRVDSDGDLSPARFDCSCYYAGSLLDAGLVSQQDIDAHRGKAQQEELNATRRQRLRLYLSLKAEYDRGELQPPTPTPDPSGA